MQQWLAVVRAMRLVALPGRSVGRREFVVGLVLVDGDAEAGAVAGDGDVDRAVAGRFDQTTFDEAASWDVCVLRGSWRVAGRCHRSRRVRLGRPLLSGIAVASVRVGGR